MARSQTGACCRASWPRTSGTSGSSSRYAVPAFYFASPYAVQGPTDDVRVPRGSSLFDLELEVAAVIGRPGRDITVSEAEGHIAGYVLMNDWSARDLQFAEMQVRLGPVKGKDSATTLGPVLVTPDELAPHRAGNASGQELTGVPGANTSLLSWAKAIQRISRVVCRVLVASFEA